MKNTSVDKFSAKQAYKKEKLREFLIRFLYLFEIEGSGKVVDTSSSGGGKERFS